MRTICTLQTHSMYPLICYARDREYLLAMLIMPKTQHLSTLMMTCGQNRAQHPLSWCWCCTIVRNCRSHNLSRDVVQGSVKTSITLPWYCAQCVASCMLLYTQHYNMDTSHAAATTTVLPSIYAPFQRLPANGVMPLLAPV